MATKDVLLEIEESIWQKAKIEAVKRDITLKEFVAQAIENELKNKAS